MNSEQVNAVGGWCELVGVAFLVRDLMSLARYREKPKEWAAQLKQWAAQFRAWWGLTRLMAWWRRLLGRPRAVTFVEAGTAHGSLSAHGVTASTGRATLTARPGQSLKEQVEELRQRVNQLEKDVSDEKLQREQAIDAERQARRKEIQAESDERQRRIAEVRRDVDKLREVTTGDLGLRSESVLYLATGIILTAWPELVAEWLPDELKFRVALAIVLGWPALRFWWLWKRSRQDEILV
jgi:hypothetical protein